MTHVLGLGVDIVEVERIERAIAELLRSGAVPSIDARSGISTTRMGDMVVEGLAGE